MKGACDKLQIFWGNTLAIFYEIKNSSHAPTEDPKSSEKLKKVSKIWSTYTKQYETVVNACFWIGWKLEIQYHHL